MAQDAAQEKRHGTGQTGRGPNDELCGNKLERPNLFSFVIIHKMNAFQRTLPQKYPQKPMHKFTACRPRELHA